jgi:sterol desaturase/sphingolipid hydroxylase (fatty acid hydroxylase superfamily)
VLAVQDWSRPKPGEPRMFDQPLLEWFTWVHPASVPVVYAPVAAWLLWRGLSGIGPMPALGLFAAGVLLWTLMEYLIHRFSFHFTPHGRAGVVLAYVIHGVHHAYPEDHRRWITPPSLSFPIAVALYAAASLALAPSTLDPLAAGVAVGYVLYDLMHYWLHRGRMRSRVGRFLRSYHMQHHYSSPERRYGVSTPFWDYVFRTHR